ncbi:MAG: hypothetical protein FWE26_01035 [Coriobacteriia bacterium]|nr:hypothetical protein [Coriobacteriia bacterium]
MLMGNTVKAEFVNATKLFKLKLRDSRRGILLALIAMFALVILNGLMVWRGFADSTDTLASQSMFDFSALLLILAPIAIAFIFWQEATGKNSIYPQTSISRFISSQMLSFFLVFAALGIVLVLYLLMSGIFSLVSIWQPNFILGYSFNASFLALGFLAALFFLFMVTTAFSFLAVLVKAFRFYVVIPLIGSILFVLLFPILYASRAMPFLDFLYAPSVLLERSFTYLYLGPQTLVSFLAACLLTSIVLIAVGLILKHFKLDERGADQAQWALAMAYVSCVMVILVVGASSYLGDEVYLYPSSASDVFPQETQTIIIDTPAREGATMQIMALSYHRGSSDDFEMGSGTLGSDFVMTGGSLGGDLSIRYDKGFAFEWLSEDYADSRPVSSGRQVVFEYTPALFDMSSEKLLELTQPALHVSQSKDEFSNNQDLIISHSYEGEGAVLFVPIWSMMGLIRENARNSYPTIEVTVAAE